MTLKQTFRPGPVSARRVMGGVAASSNRSYLGVRIQAAQEGAPRRNPFPDMATLIRYIGLRGLWRLQKPLIGQLYPAILIATLVGLSLQARTNEGKGG